MCKLVCKEVNEPQFYVKHVCSIMFIIIIIIIITLMLKILVD
jgi:hypothetical protein